MHSRVIRFEGDGSRLDAMTQRTKETVIPQAEKFEGFRGGYWMGNRETGKGCVVTFFDSAENRDSSAERSQQIRDDVAQQESVAFKSVDNFEVVLDTGDKIHRGATHARVVVTQAEPGSAEAMVSTLRDRVIPQLKGWPGFVGGVWMGDRDTGKGVGITLFDSAESLAGSLENAKASLAAGSEAIGFKVESIDDVEIVAKAETPAHVG